jgi:hypothetical protein
MTFTELSWVELRGGEAPTDRPFPLSYGVGHVHSYTIPPRERIDVSVRSPPSVHFLRTSRIAHQHSSYAQCNSSHASGVANLFWPDMPLKPFSGKAHRLAGGGVGTNGRTTLYS